MKDNPESNIVFFEDDEVEAQAVMRIFCNCQMEYGERGIPLGFNYPMLKDLVKFDGLKMKHYLYLFNAMLAEFRKEKSFMMK